MIHYLRKIFEIEDLTEAKVRLCLEIEHHRAEPRLRPMQSKNASSELKRFGMDSGH